MNVENINNATRESVEDKLNRYLLSKSRPLGKSKAECFERVPDKRSGCEIPLADALMSGLTVADDAT